MCDRAKAKWAEKWGSAVPLSMCELGPGLTQCYMSPGPRPTSVPSGIYPDAFNRLATIDMGRKLGGGGCAPFLGEGSWVPI